MEINLENWKYIDGSMYELMHDGKYYNTGLTFMEWAKVMADKHKIDDGDFYEHLINEKDELNYKIKEVKGHIKYLINFVMEEDHETTK